MTILSRQGQCFICTHNPTFTWDLTETIFPWVLLAIVSIASPIAVILNVLVMTAVRTRKELQRASNILLSSMAVVDILVGAISMPLSVAIDSLISRQVLLDHVCILDLVNINSMYTASECSLFHLTVIAWERYVAIGKCFDYKVIVARGRVKKLAIIAWFVASSETQGQLVGTTGFLWAKVYNKSGRAPGHLLLPNEFQKRLKSRLLIGQKNFFLVNQRRGTAGRLSCLLTRGCFPHQSP